MISLSWEIYFKVEQGWLCFPPIDHMLRDTRYQATDVFWNISLRKHPPGRWAGQTSSRLDNSQQRCIKKSFHPQLKCQSVPQMGEFHSYDFLLCKCGMLLTSSGGPIKACLVSNLLYWSISKSGANLVSSNSLWRG